MVDMMDGGRPDLPWNPDRLRYWRRVMNTMGVTKAIYPDGEDVTTLLSPDADLVYDIAAYCLDRSQQPYSSTEQNNIIIAGQI